jgi:nucleotide-binding universal stress UspA family protein
MLARHGITPQILIDPADDDIGRRILGQVAGSGADMLAMGAYGRGRWREQLLGGITQQILDHATVPILTAH